VLLTGTPSPNGLLDLWAQLYLIDYGEALGRTKTGFEQRFFEPADYMGYKLKPRAGAEQTIYAAIENKVISMKAEDYLELPDRVDLIEKIELPPALQKQYLEFEQSLLMQLPDGEEVEAINAAVLAGKLLQYCNGAMYHGDDGEWQTVHDAKLDALAELLDTISENVLIAYNYKSDLVRLTKRFPKAVVLDKQLETVERWNKGETPILLAHPASAGHGLNLQQGGSVIIWFGLNWSLELYEQFNARLHRQGQTKPVRIIHLLVKDSLDERVFSVLADKSATQKS